MKKRLFSLLFALLLCLPILAACDGTETPQTPPDGGEEPPAAEAAFEFTLKADGTYAVSVGTMTEEETIVIPSEHNGKSVTEIAERGFQEAKAKRVTVPDGVTVIGASAFRGCTELSRVVLSDTVVTVGSHAFYNCKSLATLSFSEKLESIGAYAFYNCKALTSVSLPNALRSVGEGAFVNCTELLNVILPDGVAEIGASAFKGCEKLASISVPFVGGKADDASTAFLGYIFGATSPENNVYSVPAALTTVSVTNCETVFRSAFKGCDKITMLSLPATLTTVGNAAFEGCAAIEKVYVGDVGKWCAVDFADVLANPLAQGADLYVGGKLCVTLSLPESVKTVKPYVFYGCTSIKFAVVNDGAEKIGVSAFEGCENLQTVRIPESVTEIGFAAFKGCKSLEDMTLPFAGETYGAEVNTHFGYIFGGKTRDDNDLVVPHTLRYITVTTGTHIGFSAFYRCMSVQSITLPKGLVSIGNAAFSACSSLTYIEIPESVTRIGESAFSYCTALLSVSIPDGVKTVGDYCFAECEGLTSATIGKSLTAVSNDMFKNCEKLGTITFDSESELSAIGHQAFLNCTSLAAIDIPSGVLLIDSYAFAGCESLSAILIPDKVDTIKDAAFYACYSLSSVSVGNGVRAFGADVFAGCPVTGTESGNCVYLGNETNPYVVLVRYSRNAWRITVHTDTKSIAKGAFAGAAMRTINLPEGLENIGAGAFQGCRYLQSISIPSGVTVLDDSVLDGCVSLGSITFSEALTYIGRFAFRDCIALTSLVLPDTLETIEGAAFTGCTGLASIVIGSGIKEIMQEAFSGTTALARVYFKVAKIDFDKIRIDPAKNDSILTDAEETESTPKRTIFFYSEIAPTGEGNYWHYDGSGNIAVWGE